MLVTRNLDPDTDLLALHRLSPQRYPLLLESSANGTAQGRWDLLLAANGESLGLERDGRLTASDATDDRTVLDARSDIAGTDFLVALDHAWQAQRVARDEPRWPFRGGWALLLAYELSAQVEPILQLPAAPGDLPVALALRCPAAVLRDSISGECIALAESGHARMLDAIADEAAQARALPPLPAWTPPFSLHEDAPEHYLDGVVRILNYLAAGDVFQANLSRCWSAQFEVRQDPTLLFQRLRRHNPAPFAGLFAGNGWAVVSASPERLVSVRGESVETRPIAGTRPRHGDIGMIGPEDAGLIRELIAHPKERAEHVMLIDLERNDLGRICVPGSVEVDELMTVESYAHVHHLVSNVRGRLRMDTTPGEVIRAVFPGGTITGCPKVRCMQIIAELEGVGRGAYTGAFGWLGRDGDLDLNILIRSAEMEDDASGGTRLRFRTGAGIVADSDPRRELEETRAKARGMLDALDVPS